MSDKYKPFFSIVLLNFNGYQWIPPCISSILAQTFTSFEIILVDNGSDISDSSIHDAINLCKSINCATFTRNMGFAGANNFGSLFAQGTWIIFLSNDTKLDTDFLHNVHETIQSIPGSHVIVPTVTNYQNTDLGEYYFTLDILGYPTSRHGYTPFWGHGCAFTVRRDVFTSLGGFDSDYEFFFEETDFCWRAQITGHNIVGSPRARVQHFGGGTLGDGSVTNGRIVTSPRRRYLGERNRLSNLLKNYGTPALSIILVLYAFLVCCAMVALAFSRRWALLQAYVQALIWHRDHLHRTLRKRRFVQSLRSRSDFYVLKRMRFTVSELELFMRFGLPSSR